MPDSRVSLIRNARLRLGETPRDVDASDHYLRPRKSLLSIGMRAGQKKVHESFRPLLERGRVVWGSLVVARNDLFDKGSRDGRGVVTYSPHLHVHDNLDGLVTIYQKIMELRESRALSNVEITFSEQLEDSNVWFSPRPLPKAITPDKGICVSSVLVVRRHLPQSRIVAGYFPLLAHPEIESVAILPERYWPQEMKDYWNEAG